MSAEILIWNGETRLDIPPERVLEAAIEAKVRDVVVVGRAEDGSVYLATSIGSDLAKINWLLDIAKRKILEGGEE